MQILTPSQDAKITGNTLNISGKTRKNSKVTLNLNGQDIGTVVSDNDGIFTKEVSNFSQENNILKASLIDASNQVIAASPEVKFSRASESGSVYGLSIAPGTTVKSSSMITFTVDAIKGLSDVTIMMDGVALKTKESPEGKYTIQTAAPKKPGSYNIDVIAKPLTGAEIKKEKMLTLTVEEEQKAEEKKEEEKKEETKAEATPVPTFKNIKAETQKQKVIFSFFVENTPKDLANFKITYGSGSSVVTHPAEKIKKNDMYSWYIDNLKSGDYTFVIHGQTASGALIEGLKSEPIMATIGIQSCTISNV